MAQAVWFLPRLRNYAEALKKYEDTKPIRGHGERRPLGRRHDHVAFWMQKHEDSGVIDCMVHATAVLSFAPDNTVTVRNGGWITHTTHNTIQQILYPCGVEACGWRDKTKLTVNGDVYLLPPNGWVQLIPNGAGRLQLAQKQQLIGYSMNRKAANTVRRRYKEFAEYFVNMVKLRTEVQPVRNAWGTTVEVKRVNVSVGEIADVLGLAPASEGGLGGFMRPAVSFSCLGQEYSGNWHGRTARAYRPEHEKRFLQMIDPGQPEETKTENYYKAALALIVGDSPPAYSDGWEQRRDATMSKYVEGIVPHFDRALLMANAEEVLTLTKLPPGKMPNPKYRGWINKEIEVLNEIGETQ